MGAEQQDVSANMGAAPDAFVDPQVRSDQFWGQEGRKCGARWTSTRPRATRREEQHINDGCIPFRGASSRDYLSSSLTGFLGHLMEWSHR